MLKPSMIRPRGSFGSTFGIVLAVLCFAGVVATGTMRLLMPWAEQHDHPAAVTPPSSPPPTSRSAGANNVTMVTLQASGSQTSFGVFTPAPSYYDPRLIDADGRQCMAHINGGHGLTGDIGLSSYSGACRLVFGWAAPEQYQCVFDIGIVDPATISSVDRSGFNFTFEPSNAMRHIRYSCIGSAVQLTTPPLTVNGNTLLGDSNDVLHLSTAR